MDYNKLTDFFKSVYNKAYLFIGVQAFALIIIFFILDQKTGGSFFSRLFAFLFCILIGGGLALFWARKNEANPIISFRRGAGSLLMIFTILMWSNNGGYKSPYSSRNKSFISYPKTCKGGCGYPITSSSDDSNGYHFVCVPGKDGESMYNKARKL